MAETSDRVQKRSARKGRPSAEDAARLSDTILGEASRLFIKDGYGATSVEGIAAAAGISKRTFYLRFSGKADVFEAIILRNAERNVRDALGGMKAGQDLEASLHTMSIHLLEWILQPDVLGIYRLTIAEVGRFPELAQTVTEYAISDAVRSFETVFRKHLPASVHDDDIAFIAMQFMHAVASGPFYRAVQGLDSPGFDRAKRSSVRRAIKLFLQGVQAANAKT
ncbi:TetR/AcrR family transcriptional regulator [Burkholderia sp. R-69980]|nr:TetR/AcrR family transcriptional regulator [Burkholderia sp. R-69980]